MRWKKVFLSILLIFTLCFQGCFSYRDMNRLNFVTLSMVDRNERGEVMLYSEQFSPNRGYTQEGGIAKRVVQYSEGRTISDAVFNMNTSSTFPMAFDVSKALLFCESCARQGINDFVDLMERDQKLTNKVFLFVHRGDAVELLNVKLEEEQFVGVYLENIMVFQGRQSRILSIRMNEYLNQRLQGNGVALIPITEVKKKPTGDRIEVTAAAIMVDDKMVEQLSEDEIAIYKLLNNELSLGELTVDHPTQEGKLVSLLGLQNRVKSDIDYNGDSVVLSFDMEIDFTIDAVEGEMDILDDQILRRLEKITEDAEEKRIIRLFEKYQKKGIDLLGVETRVKRKYPDADLEGILDKTYINVDVKVEIEGGQNITNSYS